MKTCFKGVVANNLSVFPRKMKCNSSTATIFLLLFLCSFFTGGLFCGIGWLRYGDRCYRIYTQRLTRAMARLRCLMEGSDLASLPNESILGFLAQHIAHVQGDKFWIGLEKDLEANKLMWLDGSGNNITELWMESIEPLQSPYTEGSVNNFGRGCFGYNGTLVIRVPCYERIGMICGHNITSRRNRTKCNWGVDPVHSFIGDSTGHCLFKAPEKTTKDKAEQLCNQYDGHFVDLDGMLADGLTSFYDHQVLANDGSKYWTGFKWNGTNLFWSFGHPVHADYPIPVIPDVGSCITVQFNFTDILQTQFYQTKCDSEADVVCSKVMDVFEPPEETTELPQMDERELNCPQGYNWKSDSTTGYCYWETSYETARLSWDDAESYCKGYGGHLSSFHTIEEERIGLSFQYGNLAHPYWIGLKFDAETETYKWSDGTPLDYNNWAPGHPDHKDKTLRCVAMEAKDKHWKSSLCGILSWFICKVPAQSDPPQPVIPTPTPLQPCSSDSGGKEYFFENSCYFAGSMSFSWHRAKQYCENEGATLVSIHSVDEIGFLLKLLDESNVDTNTVWIGLNSLGPDGSFRWADWSPVDFTFFNEEEPNNFRYQEKCCNMHVSNGLWNDDNCNAAMSFICKRVNDTSETITIPSTPDPRIGNCKKGWIPHDDRCYFVGGIKLKDRVDWVNASDICQKHGAYLTSIRNEREQAFLAYLLQTLRVDAWIGLHDTIQSGRYYWLDNSDLQYTNWAPGEPSFFGLMEDCVKMVYNHVNSGVWKDDECQLQLGYICQTQKNPSLPEPSYDRGVYCIHPEGWLKLESMCFKMFEGTPLTWQKAEEACQKEGAHLVSVSDYRIQAIVTYLATEVNKSFWIGLRYKESTHRISWLNDFPALLSNWEKHEPGYLTEDTCFASTAEGYWKTAPCKDEMPYACQITTDKPLKRKMYVGNCPTPTKNWVPADNGQCYILDKSFRSDWFTANLACFRYGSELVSIHSMKDIDILKKLIQPEIKSIYLGLMRNKKGGFSWTDDSPFDFVNWDDAEPYFPLTDQPRCAEMMLNTMKWKLTSCDLKKHFVCQHSKDTLIYEDPQNAKLVDESLNSGLSALGLTAIIVCLLFVVVISVAAVLYYIKKSRRNLFHNPLQQQSVSFENALYNVNSASMEFENERL